MLEAFKYNPRVGLSLCTEIMRDDESFVRQVLSRDGQALEFALPRLKDDENVVKWAYRHVAKCWSMHRIVSVPRLK